MPERLERMVMAKVSWRLLPLIFAIYFVAYIDRTNVGFAALSMNRQLGLSSQVFGWGAGIFFLGYFLFEVPSNLLLERTGARIWICRIMLTWGLASGAMAWVGGAASFVLLRFLLGVAEAGLFPGMLLYLTYWYPASYRARVIAALYMAAPAANAVAAAISGPILKLDGLMGLAGWRWIFIIEAIPAVVLALVVLGWLTDRPGLARWLRDEERAWLDGRLQSERRAIEKNGSPTLRRALTDSRTLILTAIYFALNAASYGITFFLPQIVKLFGFSEIKTGLVTAVPYVVGTIGMMLWGYSSDRRNERRCHLIVAAGAAALGLLGVGLLSGSYWALAAMSLAAVGLYGTKPAFWPLPSLYLTGPAAAAGIAFINGAGNLGGFVGPYVVGEIKDATASFKSGLYFLAACAACAGLISFAFLRFDLDGKKAA